MQTTLRIDDAIYRQAKVEAAREGITLTQFIHEALALRLGQRPASGHPELPSFQSGSPVSGEFDLVQAMKQAEQAYDLELTRQLIAGDAHP